MSLTPLDNPGTYTNAMIEKQSKKRRLLPWHMIHTSKSTAHNSSFLRKPIALRIFQEKIDLCTENSGRNSSDTLTSVVVMLLYTEEQLPHSPGFVFHCWRISE